jgi:hypothetical protein
MADDKDARDKQAQDAERRQRERELEEALERGDEAEPPMATAETAAVDAELEALSYPATGSDVVTEIGDREIDVAEDTARIGELIPDTSAEAFEDPDTIRTRVRYPDVARAMKRIVETTGPLQTETLGGSQRDAYEKTLRALADVDALDDDAVLDELVAWVVRRTEEEGALPGSRAVRRQAAKICRVEGYTISNNDWLGI